ncbi:aminotransferase class I/II-fold pyridoxal phosphate-dependent enzyme [Cutibacterium equinum]|uniref:cysteine-S-conjugate beta-lyase n=1 Tax=Cutibacterium equinum TaxID=3016342 RepID=A0ABY7QZC2_9ACTN|nr:aminotransferase class I/II-fold pyridoxal phosphate-dependent enzyme [Cutibacterium equinum]WCC79829.1 aminotransferase class I/II-fold pyridoxal phosphate-dependent enzyme [Cutibacterium equinum]
MTDFDFDSPTVEWLRSRGTARWQDVAEDVIPLWVAEMDFRVAPPIQRAIEDTVANHAYGYPCDNGLRHSWAAWVKKVQGLTIDPLKVRYLRNVLSGVQLAIRTYSAPGSPVIVPSPAYMPFWEVPGLEGREIIAVPMIDSDLGWTLDLDGIDAAFGRGAGSLILCQPYNPLGRVFTADELGALAEVVESHHGFVISDEIHGPLVPACPERKASVPYATVSEAAAAHSVLVSSASKSFNIPGLMTAFITLFTPEQAKLWDEKVHPLDAAGATTIGLAANKAAFDSGQEWLDAANRYIHDNAVWLSETLADQLPAVDYRVPEGTYLGWLDFSAYELPTSPGQWLLRHARIRLNDGPTFGPGGEGHARINFATPRYLLEEAVDRMVSAINSR